MRGPGFEPGNPSEAAILVETAIAIAVLASLLVATPAAYYVFFAAIEIAATSIITRYAWKWPNLEDVQHSFKRVGQYSREWERRLGSTLAMKLSYNGKILATLLLVQVVVGILLTPLGFETRASAFLSSPSSSAWLGLAFTGLILTPASFVLLYFRPRIASVLATIGSIALVVLSVADQAGLPVSVRPPLMITALEIATTVVIAAILFFAWRVYKEPSVVPE